LVSGVGKDLFFGPLWNMRWLSRLIAASRPAYLLFRANLLLFPANARHQSSASAAADGRTGDLKS
jgi:hypothetical protein